MYAQLEYSEIIYSQQTAFSKIKSSDNSEIPEYIINFFKGIWVPTLRINLKGIIFPDIYTELQEWMFKECKTLEYVVLPNTIKKINKYTFFSCTNLKDINFTDTLEEIEACAFQNCFSLKDLFLPDNIKEIKANAFCHCTGLKYVALLEGMESIEEGSFCMCYNLTDIYLPKKLKNIDFRAFADCKKLHISIPDNVNFISSRAFTGVKHIYYFGKLEDSLNNNWGAIKRN